MCVCMAWQRACAKSKQVSVTYTNTSSHGIVDDLKGQVLLRFACMCIITCCHAYIYHTSAS